LTCILDRKSTRRQPVRLAVFALLVLGMFVPAAGAQPHRDDRRRDDRRFDHHDDRGCDGGYYPSPVVYGGLAYAPPPVVYGPAVSIYLPGVSIGIQ